MIVNLKQAFSLIKSLFLSISKNSSPYEDASTFLNDCTGIVPLADCSADRTGKDINTDNLGLGVIYTVWEKAVANNMQFMVVGNTDSYQLWRSDGTSNGTIQLTDNNYLNNGSGISNLISAGNYVCFKMVYEGEDWLFRSDGTKEGTYPLHKLVTYNTPDTPGASLTNPFQNINGTVYFSLTHVSVPKQQTI